MRFVKFSEMRVLKDGMFGKKYILRDYIKVNYESIQG